MSNKEYRDREGISSTELKRMAVSPAHYKWFKDNPIDSDTTALMFGRAAHKFILENEYFYTEFAVAPKCDNRTKVGKEEWASFVEANQGKDILTIDQYDQLVAMREALMNTPFASKLLVGDHEKSFFWDDEETGLKCKCRPDSFNEKLGICIDYKTSENAETTAFMNKSIKLNYDLQAAYYLDGLKANLDKDFIFVFIAQEKKPPYSVNILQCSDEYIKSGRDLYKSMLETYKRCTETGNWYGYLGENGEINNLELPTWLKRMYEGEEETEKFN